MICDYCGADEERYFFQGSCRRCLPFRNKHLNQKKSKFLNIDFEMPFKLTIFQENVVDRLGQELKSDVFLEAVCGAGKTEMCLPMLVYALNHGLSCGWTVPRREIVLELSDRLRKYFPNLKIVSVCQGYTLDIEGDLVIATTHQLYRYKSYFDLLILDEPDAFPYAGNQMLKKFVENSIKNEGKIIYLSATKDATMHEKIERNLVQHIELPIRPNLKLLPVPIWRLSIFYFLFFLIDLYKHRQEQSLIFVPTRKMARKLSFILCSPHITSETENKEIIISRFRNKKFRKLVTTTVLERGVTFEEVFGFVVCADHPVFNEASLIQISGRVQRGIKASKGECFFYSKGKSLSIQQCIKTISEANNTAHSVMNP